MHVFLFRALRAIYLREYRNCYQCVFCAFSVLYSYLSISDLNSLSRLICPLLHVHTSSDFFSSSSFQPQVFLARQLPSFRQAPQILVSAAFSLNMSHFSSCGQSVCVFSLSPFALSQFVCFHSVPAQNTSRFSCAVSHSIFFSLASTSIYCLSHHTPFPSSQFLCLPSLYFNHFCFLRGLDAIKVGSLGRRTVEMRCLLSV